MLRVSVIIPTYNRANYLYLALESVLKQSFPPYEIIIVDDGSDDATPDVVHEFASHVRYLHQDHQGVAAARNLGLASAQGDVIAWLDADDLWNYDFLASTIRLLEADAQLDGVYSDYHYIGTTGEIVSVAGIKPVRPSDLFAMLVEADIIATPAVVIRKRCYDQVGSFDTRFQICEDYDMWLRLARIAQIKGISKPLVSIRVHPTNTQADIDAFGKYLLMLMDKHFGPLAVSSEAEPDIKRRAYASAFRLMAVKHIQAGDPDRGWSLLEQAISIRPELFCSLDTLYELACGAQARGVRGRADLINVQSNGDEMLARLDTLFARFSPGLDQVRAKAYGNAYLALGMLSDQAGKWRQARHYMFEAVRANPALLCSYLVMRRLVKVHLGRQLIGRVRLLRDSP